tara:strand:- start:12102 stop:12926 length:825 start_codon:yes stop_codon:yes gene_type:complete
MYGDCPLRWKLNYVDRLSISESGIHLIFGTAMHEVLQAYLEVMYFDTVKNADKLPLEEMLRDNLIKEFKKAEEADGKPPSTKKELGEFFQDGCNIIDFFKKRRGQYFGKNEWELIGCEVPIDLELKNNIRMIGYLDIVLKSKITNKIKIIDIKTSTQGWNKWMKMDKNKTQQLLLYKEFYSRQYNHPVKDIDIEYFIVKRKLWENADFPQKRVQLFVPASGTPSMNKMKRSLENFVLNAFDDEGEYKTDMVATPSKKACKWCEFRKTEYCDKGV